jgi:hypothetical protein
MKNILLSFLLIGIFFIGLIPEYPHAIFKAIISDGGIELMDSEHHPIESFAKYVTFLSDVNRSDLCITMPKSVKLIEYAYHDGYLISVISETIQTPPIVWEDKGVRLVTSRILTGDALAYDTKGRDTHSEEKTTVVIVREPPYLSLPPKRTIL